MAGPYFIGGLTAVQLTFMDDVPQEGPGGAAQSAWAYAMSLITQERYSVVTRWGRQSDDLRRVYILISCEEVIYNDSAKPPMGEITSTSLSSTLLPLFPYLSDAPRLVYLRVPNNARAIWAQDTAVTMALDIIYIRVTRDSDLQAFVDNLQFGTWILGPGRRNSLNSDVCASLRGWSEHGSDAVIITYAILIYWDDRDSADRFKDLTRPCFSHGRPADDTWGREILALLRELSSRGAAIEHVSVDFGSWPYLPIPYHRRYTKKRGLSLPSRCVVS
ncbi:hypothetical protein BU16DRAFT_542697 [Lophium mytilinum]|uniref:Uncharacterized protein n=1 Tax=Lophium mytilinum TaxID=390894 RepID=A0A6A6QHB0_9PEZI|nr:hypothetical protein BU16DRAFT_542697 [Lophium mytilinum]